MRSPGLRMATGVTKPDTRQRQRILYLVSFTILKSGFSAKLRCTVHYRSPFVQQIVDHFPDILFLKTIPFPRELERLCVSLKRINRTLPSGYTSHSISWLWFAASFGVPHHEPAQMRSRPFHPLAAPAETSFLLNDRSVCSLPPAGLT